MQNVGLIATILGSLSVLYSIVLGTKIIPRTIIIQRNDGGMRKRPRTMRAHESAPSLWSAHEAKVQKEVASQSITRVAVAICL